MTSQDPFSYTAITEPDTIRVIIVEPSEDLTSPICCSLVTMRLPKNVYNDRSEPTYNALSYVWGSTAGPLPVYVDGKRFDVTQSLHSALRHLRDPKEPARIWADAICINQQDNAEKLQQVQMMEKVYRSADETTIYVGDATPSSDTFLEAIATYQPPTYGEYMRTFDHGPGRHVPGSATPDAIAFRDALLPDMQAFFARPWFSRTWTFQELVLSFRPRVQSGARRVPWARLALCLRKIFDYDYDGPAVQGHRELTRVFQLDNAMRRVQNGTNRNFWEREQLLSYLVMRRGLGVTDPRVSRPFSHFDEHGVRWALDVREAG